MKRIAVHFQAILFAVSLFSGVIADRAKANVFDDMWGIVTDPLKANSSSKNVLRSLVQLKELESVNHNHVNEYINSLREILNNSFQRADGIANRLSVLEDKIHGDIIESILRAKCATNEVLNGQLQQAIATALNTINVSNPKLKIGQFTIFDLKTHPVKIEDPDRYYWATKSIIMESLEKEITEQSDAQQVFSAYVNLEILAKQTRCFYIDTVEENDFINETADMELMAIPWRANFTTVP